MVGKEQRWGYALILILAIAPTARAADEDAVVAGATYLLQGFTANPKSGIPPEVLCEARAIMIMPPHR